MDETGSVKVEFGFFFLCGFSVGAIAICGAEKTVVYANDQSPPGKTYPIGASQELFLAIRWTTRAANICVASLPRTNAW